MPALAGGGVQMFPGRTVGDFGGQACNLVGMVVKIVLEPIGEGGRLLLDAPSDLIGREVVDGGNLCRIGPKLGGERAEIDVDEFVLLHSVAEVALVAGVEAE